MPDHSSRYPIQRTPVPEKVKMARAPVSMASTALPPLWKKSGLESQEPV